MIAERRCAARQVFRGGHLPPAARIRPGRDVIVVDLSSIGILVEGPWRFRPGSRCDLQLGSSSPPVEIRARVLRCFVARLERFAPVRYRTAMAFEGRLDVPAGWDALAGYELPGAEDRNGSGGVVATPGALGQERSSQISGTNRPVRGSQ
jgi:hypothetical protein